MPQIIIDTDEEEDNKVLEYSKEWNLNKHKTIKKIIRDFEVKE